ncbi:MAG TPA: hypothetical protein VHB79_37720 [Polyangiaceae bacterium]|nr:hypothetical protein [Polyangiaceae bacterium]
MASLVSFRSLLALALATSSLGCRDIDRFNTQRSEAYCGHMVVGPGFYDGLTAEKQIAQTLAMKLKLDTSQLGAFSNDEPVRLGFLSSNDKADGLCSQQKQPLFKSSPLRGIPQLDHDTLSTLSFGEGHDDDFFAWTDSTCQGTMLALVSLLRKGDVELRLFKPAALPPPDAGPDERPGYALFYLQRSDDEHCGF